MALAALKGEKTLAELVQQYAVHPNLINQWRTWLLEGAADVFGTEPATIGPLIDVTVPHAKIGELTQAVICPTRYIGSTSAAKHCSDCRCNVQPWLRGRRLMMLLPSNAATRNHQRRLYNCAVKSNSQPVKSCTRTSNTKVVPISLLSKIAIVLSGEDILQTKGTRGVDRVR